MLSDGQKAGDAEIEQLMRQVHASPAGWQSAMHLFDYNLDFHEIGVESLAEALRAAFEAGRASAR